MPLDPRVQRFLGLLAAANPPAIQNVSVAERRSGLAALLRMGAVEIALPRVIDCTLPGPAGPLALRVYSPVAGASLLPGLVYFHGGGLVAGSIDTHDSIARSLAYAGGCRVLSVQYRLAPENRFPAALEDALAALRYIGTNPASFDLDAARIGICGDSAGATLAVAAANAYAETPHQGPPLAQQVLICPILDYSGTTPSRLDLSNGYLIDQATLEHDLRHYLPAGIDPADPRVSPLNAAKLSGTPTLIHSAEYDPLRDEGCKYFERLKHAGVEVSYTCHPGMIHLFYGLGAVIPYAREAIAQIGAEIRSAFAIA